MVTERRDISLRQTEVTASRVSGERLQFPLPSLPFVNVSLSLHAPGKGGVKISGQMI